MPLPRCDLDWRQGRGRGPMRQSTPIVPCAAATPLRPPPRPRKIKAMPTAMAPPATGPTRYAHHDVQSPLTSAGPSERAGFIDAPLTGEPHSPAKAMYPPTPNAASGPIACAPDAVPKITLTSPAVSTSSHSIAVVVEIPAPGRVSPALPCLPISAHNNNVAKIAPRNWATTYAGTRFHGKSPRAANAKLTAGFRCAPDTVPMNKMMAITISAGATTLAP